nr:MAG TPA_asm: hypothetical protein [Caudoviricetes sp.]
MPASNFIAGYLVCPSWRFIPLRRAFSAFMGVVLFPNVTEG